MFKWIKRWFSGREDIHIWLHVDGKLRLNNDYRSPASEMVVQGPVNSISPTETKAGDDRRSKDFEETIAPEIFANTEETEVNFGNEVEFPSKETKNKDK